jgi:hypothetical protein
MPSRSASLALLTSTAANAATRDMAAKNASNFLNIEKLLDECVERPDDPSPVSRMFIFITGFPQVG